MRYFLYNLLLCLAAPIGAVYLLFSKRHRPLLRRFWPITPDCTDAPLWVHACSVGEIGVARAFIAAFKNERTETPILLTVSTLSGLAQTPNLGALAETTLAPFDLACCVRSFVRRVRPRALVLIETELWPNLVRETRRHGIPVVVVNGRISPKKFPRCQRYRRVMPPVYAQLSAVGVQNALYAERFAALGVPVNVIDVTGNMKCDAVVSEVDMLTKKLVRAENGFSRQDVVVVFGSTRPGDEGLAADCWRTLKDDYPHLRFVIAPRHLDRIDDALLPFKEEAVQRRSHVMQRQFDWRARVFYLDTLGELVKFYAIAQIAVIGGSFYHGVEGHNPLEPAALGTPTIFGPFMGNFPDAAAVLLDNKGAFQATSPEALASLLHTLLDDSTLSHAVGTSGRKAVLDNRGAVARNVDLVLRRCDAAPL